MDKNHNQNNNHNNRNNNKNRNNNTVKNMCQNPFFPCQGKTNRIAVIIRLKNQDHEICEDCWNKLADSNISWGEPLPRRKKVISPLGAESFRFFRKR
jgi:hypothetical protein